MKRFVFDASALLAFLEDREGAAEAEQLLRGVIERKASLLIPTASWGEAVTALHKGRSDHAVQELLGRIMSLPLEFVELDRPTAQSGAKLSAVESIPFCLASAAIVAKAKHAVLVTVHSNSAAVAGFVKTLVIGTASKEE